MKTQKLKKIVLLSIVFLLTSSGFSAVLPPTSKPHGASYSEWSARWWQWALRMPINHHPLTDTADASEGQEGNVWFLGGAFSSVGPIERHITVPPCTSLFFPIVNQAFVAFPGDPTDVDLLRSIIRDIMDSAAGLSVEIDGRPIQHLDRFRFESVVFGTDFPEVNMFGIPAGHYSPAVDDGYYLMLTPLSHGIHTLHFTATLPAMGLTLDVTYYITVEKL